MKLITYEENNYKKIGVMYSDFLILPLKSIGINFEDMNEYIDKANNKDFEKITKELNDNKNESNCINISSVKILSPIPNPKQDIICLGINYAAHAEESARYKKEAFERNRSYPIYFSKRVNDAAAPNSKIPLYENLVDSLDYECELAVIIGKDAKNISKNDAFEYVFGYTIINDISARNLQTRHKQWYFGKSLDGFTPMGPCIVTKDEFNIPPILKIMSRVNSELRQNSTTDLLIFDIPHVISELSQGMTLKAGTIISMGTPAGVGMGFTPPKFLKSGDIIECEIEGIGILKNTIV